MKKSLIKDSDNTKDFFERARVLLLTVARNADSALLYVYCVSQVSGSVSPGLLRPVNQTAGFILPDEH